jgi:hypothetical protein
MALAKKKGERKNTDSAQMEKSAAVRSAGEKKQRQNLSEEADAGEYHSTSLGLTRRSEDDETLTEIGNTTAHDEDDLESLREKELSGSSDNGLKSVNYSDTDEDENEGLGDGNLGRSLKGSMGE